MTRDTSEAVHTDIPLVNYFARTIYEHWLLIHALVAPWGVFVATGLLVNINKSISWQSEEFWRFWADITGMSSAAGYGTIVYGIVVSSTEVIVRVAFYAIAKIIEERRRWQEERRRWREEGREEGIAVGKRRGIDSILANPRFEQYPDLLEELREDVEDTTKQAEENGHHPH